MKIKIHSIGKDREFERLCLEYTKRLPWKISFTQYPASKDLAVAKKEETSKLALSAKGMYWVALDEHGSEFSSIEFAKQLEDLTSKGVRNICFTIAGAYGYDTEVLKEADMRISLSKMTFPHALVKLILVEQIYRAYTIINGHPYHK